MDYAHLDPAEREWLTNVSPTDVRDNAHRFYDFMTETGQPAESVIREEAFRKAANALGIDYDVLYNAWLSEEPVAVRGCSCGMADYGAPGHEGHPDFDAHR